MAITVRSERTSLPPSSERGETEALPELARLCRVVSRTSLPPDAKADQVTANDRLLRACAERARDAVIRVHESHRATPVTQACQVAHLGLREAEGALGQRSAEPSLEALRIARLKVFLALLTLRHTLVRAENERVPLWRTLSPALAARRALAAFRDALESQIEQGDVDIPWRLFVTQGELGLLLVHPALSALSDASRDGLAFFAAALRDVRDGGPEACRRFAQGKQVVDQALLELSERPELRTNDEHVLRGFLSLLGRGRRDRGLRETARSLLFAVRGLDPELDEIATEIEAGRSLAWSELVTRAAEIVAERFGKTWRSGAPPRVLR